MAKVDERPGHCNGRNIKVGEERLVQGLKDLGKC